MYCRRDCSICREKQRKKDTKHRRKLERRAIRALKRGFRLRSSGYSYLARDEFTAARNYLKEAKVRLWDV